MNDTDTCLSIYYLDDEHNMSMGCAEASVYNGIEDYDMVECPNGITYYFSRLYVNPRYRGNGLGRKLYDDLCSILDRKSATLIIDINPYGDLDYNQLKSFYMSNGAIENEFGQLVRHSG